MIERGFTSTVVLLAIVAVFSCMGCASSRRPANNGETHVNQTVPQPAPLPTTESDPRPMPLLAANPQPPPTLPRVPSAPTPEVVKLASAEAEEPLPNAASSPAASLQQPPEVLPPTSPVETAIDVATSELLAAESHPIDLPTALAITTGQNPQVAYARQRIQEAFAQLEAADVLWVPTLRGGMNYNKHEGRIQDVAGRMIKTSRGSVYGGLGAQAVGASSPAVPGLLMDFQLRDAIYEPRISERVLAARQEASRATTNDMLLETALAYNDLLEALQIEAVAKNTLEHARTLTKVTGDFARTGQGLLSDADRALTELAIREIDVLRTMEGVQVASVRLARVLSIDPSIPLAPQEPALVPINLAPVEQPLPELVAIGLSNRPELAESRFLVGAAVERLRSEMNAVLMPSVLLGLSYGGNGGGIGSNIENFGDRLDFDAVAFWEVRNLGFGEQAARNEARSRVQQSRWQEVRVLDQVASDVAETYAQVISRRGQIDIAQAGITAATQSYQRNIERIEQGLGLPIEALQAIQALDSAQRRYVRSVADYNQAQFALQRALGWPVR